MQIIEIKTLIDITSTGVNRHKTDSDKEFNQQKNYVTLLQCIGLRAIIDYQESPVSETIELKESKFGSKYKGKHRVWTFRFTTDRLDSFVDDEGNSMGLLTADLHEVPVIKNLDETINISKAVFDLSDPSWKNTIITSIHGVSEN